MHRQQEHPVEQTHLVQREVVDGVRLFLEGAPRRIRFCDQGRSEFVSYQAAMPCFVSRSSRGRFSLSLRRAISSLGGSDRNSVRRPARPASACLEVAGREGRDTAGGEKTRSSATRRPTGTPTRCPQTTQCLPRPPMSLSRHRLRPSVCRVQATNAKPLSMWPIRAVPNPAT
jgi:hypothetical protein